MSKLAALFALLVAAAGVTVIVFVMFPGESSEPVALVSSRQCLECHVQVAQEWEASHHAFAFANPEVRRLSNDFQNEECLACHAPRPVLDFAPGERVLARGSDRDLGVDCLACHALPAGEQGVATGRANPNADAPCRPRTVDRMRDVNHCGSCHNQHGTVDQWEASPAEIRGKVIQGDGCLHCHMPEVFRPGGRPGFDHTFRAAHDLATLQSAVEVTGEWQDGTIQMGVENIGCAHNFPTDERSRAADVQVRWRIGGEWGEWEHVWRMRDPYRDEADLTNTQLPAGETWVEQLTHPEGATEAEVRLLFRTNPFQPDEEAAEIARVPLRP